MLSRRRVLLALMAAVAAFATGWSAMSVRIAFAEPAAPQAQAAPAPATSPMAAAAAASPTVAAATPQRAGGPVAPATPAGSPVAVNGQLHVCGVKLCNEAGKPVQLHGMSSHGLQFFPDCVNRDSLTALRTDWNADLIRLSMYVQEGGLETDPPGFTAKVNALVDEATALGFYVAVDFHVLTPGDPNRNLGLAKKFFADVAAAHTNNNNVLYEIANEPNGVSWAGIKSYAEQVIPVIRKKAPEAVVLVGTRGFSSLGVAEGSDETEVINDPVDADNIMYTFHFYAASHKDFPRTVLARAATHLPMFVSEFGTQTFTGDGPNYLASATTWLKLLTSRKISYAMWSFSDSAQSNSVFRPGTCRGTDFTGTTVLTESGNFIRNQIRTATGAA